MDAQQKARVVKWLDGHGHKLWCQTCTVCINSDGDQVHERDCPAESIRALLAERDALAAVIARVREVCDTSQVQAGNNARAEIRKALLPSPAGPKEA